MAQAYIAVIYDVVCLACMDVEFFYGFQEEERWVDWRGKDPEGGEAQTDPRVDREKPTSVL